MVTEVGATLRSYEVDGDPLLWGFGADEPSSAGRGQVLAPWPNRLDSGRYCFDGVEIVVPLDEPSRGNAIHGLVRWLTWRIGTVGVSSCRLSCVLHPQPAYPFTLALALEYRLGSAGLSVHLRASNEGRCPLPLAVGFHPYLDAGPGGLAGARLVLPVTRRLRLDSRGLPEGSETVSGTRYEAVNAGGRGAVGDLVLDDCFSGLVPGADGRWRARLERPGAQVASVALWADPAFGYVMCFTGDSLPASQRRRAVAVEPMTAPPNALASGEALIVLEPGQSTTASWGIEPGA